MNGYNIAACVLVAAALISISIAVAVATNVVTGLICFGIFCFFTAIITFMVGANQI